MSAVPMRCRDNQSGVTLIELLVSMIVLAIVSTMLIQGWISLAASHHDGGTDQ